MQFSPITLPSEASMAGEIQPDGWGARTEPGGEGGKWRKRLSLGKTQRGRRRVKGRRKTQGLQRPYKGEGRKETRGPAWREPSCPPQPLTGPGPPQGAASGPGAPLGRAAQAQAPPQGAARGRGGAARPCGPCGRHGGDRAGGEGGTHGPERGLGAGAPPAPHRWGEAAAAARVRPPRGRACAWGEAAASGAGAVPAPCPEGGDPFVPHPSRCPPFSPFLWGPSGPEEGWPWGEVAALRCWWGAGSSRVA